LKLGCSIVKAGRLTQNEAKKKMAEVFKMAARESSSESHRKKTKTTELKCEIFEILSTIQNGGCIVNGA
jgi:polyhydroxyalkanoate synthesis regulator phasin